MHVNDKAKILFRLLAIVLAIILAISVFYVFNKNKIWNSICNGYITMNFRYTEPIVNCYNNTDSINNYNIVNIIVGKLYPYLKNEKNNNQYQKSYAVNVYKDGDGNVHNKTSFKYVAESTDSKDQTESVEEKDEVSVANDKTSNIICRQTPVIQKYSIDKVSDSDFCRKFYTVTSATQLTDEIFRPSDFINYDMKIKQDNSKPQILIFHTHSQEGFVDSLENDDRTSIVGVGDYLTEILVSQYGYNVIHDRTVYDYVDGKLDRSKAYAYSEQGIDKILANNPQIEVIIDLHRDGLPENVKFVTQINDKNVARIMFFNGISYSKMKGNIGYLRNNYRDENMAMSLQMYLMGSIYYPEFLRNNYVNAYRYCLHKRGKSMLIEAGSQNNTFEEVKNSMEPLADILNKVLSGQKAY